MAAIARCREPLGNAHYRPGAFHRVITAYREGILNALKIRLQACGEQRMAHNVEIEPHQLRHNIKHFSSTGTLFPSLQHSQRVLFHYPHKPGNLLALEGRLGHLPLPLPQRPFTGEQAFSQRKSQDAVVAAFTIVARIGLQDLQDVFRMSDLVRDPQAAIAHNIAEFERVAKKAPERVLAEGTNVSEERCDSRAGSGS